MHGACVTKDPVTWRAQVAEGDVDREVADLTELRKVNKGDRVTTAMGQEVRTERVQTLGQEVRTERVQRGGETYQEDDEGHPHLLFTVYWNTNTQ